MNRCTQKTHSARRRVLAPAALVALALAPSVAAAQAAQDVLSDALGLYEQRLDGVDDVTIRQEVMGMPTTTYMVKEEVEGRPVLQVRSVDGAAEPAQGTENLTDAWADPRTFYEEWADRWTLEGEGSVDGQGTWRLQLADFEGIDWEEAGLEEGDSSFEPDRMVIELEQGELVPLRVDVQGEVVDDGNAHPMDATIHFSDYREVEGYLHPYQMTLESDATALGLSDDEMAVALEELQDMPADQRAAMEQMLGDELDFLMEMLEGDGITMEVVVTDLQVNAGPPSGR